MLSESLELIDASRVGCADRIGMARLAKMAFDGWDLRPLCRELTAKLLDGTAEAGEGLDLSLIAQLLGDKETGLAVQQEILASHQLFRSPCAANNPRLRVLALAAATDMGSNTPIEFLLENSGIELMTLYVIPEVELPQPLPDHDIAIVIASDSEDCRDALRKIGLLASSWPRPLLNPPKLVCNLDRDKLCHLLHGIDGLEIPATIPVTRAQLLQPPASTGAAAGIGTGADDASASRGLVTCDPRGTGKRGRDRSDLDADGALDAIPSRLSRDGRAGQAVRHVLDTPEQCEHLVGRVGHGEDLREAVRRCEVRDRDRRGGRRDVTHAPLLRQRKIVH